MSSTRNKVLTVLAVGAVFLAVGATLDDSITAPGPRSENPGSAGLRVAIDPESGTIVPLTAADKAAIDARTQNMLSQSTAGLTEVHHADGSVSVNLEGRFQSQTVARINPDGTVTTDCVTSLAERDAFIADQSPTPATANPKE